MKAWITGISAAALLGSALAVGVAGSGDDRIAPGIRIGGTEVGGLTRDAARAKLGGAVRTPQLSITAAGRRFEASASQYGWTADLDGSLQAAVKVTDERTLLEKLQALVGSAPKVELPLLAKVNPAVAGAALAVLLGPLEQAPVNAKVYFDKTRYAVKPGQDGVRADIDSAVQVYVANPALTQLSVNVATAPPQYTTEAMQALVKTGNSLVRPIKVTLAGQPNRATSLTALQVADLYWVRAAGIELDQATLKAAVERVVGAVETPAQNARYLLQGGQLVRVAERDGVTVDRAAALELLSGAVKDPTITALVVPATVSEPTLKLADLPDVKQLSLIATGRSTYYGSHAERMTNVAVAAGKLNGAIIAPGETFSFLKTIGHISAGNGFVTGLIISGGRTVEGLGGGVCQVSTTTFRALYSAGLPVVERNQHAYRVGYYEPQVGFEAAVYDPGVDLKMKNDTGGPIMLRTVNNRAARRLDIQVWGLPQSRKVSVSGATILSRTPHPRALYVTTPRLRPGQTRQIDWAQDGYNLFITRTIKDAAGVRTDRVSTTYKPWQAVFEVGGRPAAPRPSTVPASSPAKTGTGST